MTGAARPSIAERLCLWWMAVLLLVGQGWPLGSLRSRQRWLHSLVGSRIRIGTSTFGQVVVPSSEQIWTIWLEPENLEAQGRPAWEFLTAHSVCPPPGNPDRLPVVGLEIGGRLAGFVSLHRDWTTRDDVLVPHLNRAEGDPADPAALRELAAHVASVWPSRMHVASAAPSVARAFEADLPGGRRSVPSWSGSLLIESFVVGERADEPGRLERVVAVSRARLRRLPLRLSAGLLPFVALAWARAQPRPIGLEAAVLVISSVLAFAVLARLDDLAIWLLGRHRTDWPRSITPAALFVSRSLPGVLERSETIEFGGHRARRPGHGDADTIAELLEAPAYRSMHGLPQHRVGLEPACERPVGGDFLDDGASVYVESIDGDPIAVIRLVPETKTKGAIQVLVHPSLRTEQQLTSALALGIAVVHRVWSRDLRMSVPIENLDMLELMAQVGCRRLEDGALTLHDGSIATVAVFDVSRDACEDLSTVPVFDVIPWSKRGYRLTM